MTDLFRVYYINHGYYSAEEFTTIDAALAYGKSRGFEFTVSSNKDGPVAGWSVFGGTWRDRSTEDAR
jgi:hypothetical protein